MGRCADVLRLLGWDGKSQKMQGRYIVKADGIAVSFTPPKDQQ